MIHLTLKDIREMKYMGYHYKVYFKRPNGILFPKSFTKREEMDKFINEADHAGCTVVDIFEI